MATKVYDIERIGLVSFTRRKGSKRISMRVKADGVISVNYPWHATQNEVVNFVKSNLDWIEKQKKKLDSAKTKYELNQIVSTKFHQIKIVSINQGKLRGALKGSEVLITVPSTYDMEDLSVQEFIHKVLVEVCRKEAKSYLPARVSELAELHGFHYQKVFVKNLKSKWGSCSSLGNVNLNLHLMRLPDELIDYIILHELSHTVEMNHSPRFWEVLDKVTNGQARALDKRMKTEGKFLL